MPVVDDSFLYKKYKKLSESAKEVALLSIPSPPVSGWTAMTAQNFQELCYRFTPTWQAMLAVLVTRMRFAHCLKATHIGHGRVE